MKIWTKERIIKDLWEIVKLHNMETFPSHTEIEKHYGTYGLTNAISRNGGSKYFANIMGLKIKECESKFGEAHEELCIEQIEEKFGYSCEHTDPRFPYDILVDKCVKIDVKAGKIYTTPQNAKFYSFNLEKRQQTCDIFVCYCLNEELGIDKTLIIPSFVLSGKNQLSVGKESRYDKYKDAWNFIKTYRDFISSQH